MATYVLGDIHGAYLALEQVLERSPFTPQEDKLIFLGDVVDGWPDTPKCVKKLLSLPDAVFIEGNHDTWCREWMQGQAASVAWLSQGGKATWDAYKEGSLSTMRRHKELYFERMVPYYELDGNLFVHGGYNPDVPIDQQTLHELSWDRSLWEKGWKGEGYTNVFIGHTTTTRTSLVPELRGTNVWNLDQGAGWEGRLSLMNVETKEFVQSDIVKELYPGHPGRGTFRW